MATAPAAVRGVSPKDIWDALLAAGFSSVQAAGVMGNMISESSLNVESSARDSNGAMAYGLVSWNAASYPNAASLVTGNPQADLKRQVDFLASSGGRAAASGTTVRDTAGNFAARYERCQGCQPGGSQWTTRVAQAATVAGWAASGNWPSSKGDATTKATLTAAQAAEQGQAQKACAWSIGWGGIPDTSWLKRIFSFGLAGGNAGAFEACLLSKSQARAMAGFGLLGVGGVVMFGGVQLMFAAAALDLASKLGAGRIAIIPSIGGGLRRPPAGAGGASGQGPPAAPAAAGDQVQQQG